MLRYLAKRVAMMIPTLIGVTILVFLLIHMVPGDPARTILGENADEAAITAMREKLGLNRPLPVQYLHFAGAALQGDLGISIRANSPVSEDLKLRLPPTVELALTALLIAVALGIPIGVISATRRDTWPDNLGRVGALLGVSIPVFWLGLLAIYFVGVRWRLLPFTGRIALDTGLESVTNFYLFDALLAGNWKAFSSAFKHLLLPSLVLSTIPLAIIMRMTRSAVLEVLRKDYIRTARAKGLSSFQVVIKHALKNAIIPVITTIGTQLGNLLGGAVVTETIFSWPGLGMYMFSGVMSRDYPVVQGTTLMVAVLFVLLNLLVDVSYALFNPKIRFE